MTLPMLDPAVLPVHEPELVCGSDYHGDGPRPKAHWWYDAHGCKENVLCTECLVEARTVFGENVVLYGGNMCVRCKKHFTVWESFFRVVRL